MAGSLPTTIEISAKALGPHLSVEDLELAQEIAEKLPVMKAWLDRTNPLTFQQATIAVAYMKDAARIRDIIWTGDTTDVQKAYELHRSLTTKRANKVKFFDGVVELCKRITGRHDIEQSRKAEAQRLEQERLAREQTEAQRKAEADALLAEAAATGDESLVEEAIRVEQTPITPQVVPMVETPKLEGVSVRMEKYGRVTNVTELLIYLVNAYAADGATIAYHPRLDLITEILGDPKDWKVNAPIRRGVTLSGVVVEERPITTNRRAYLGR